MKPTDVRCPHCGAEPGEKCIGRVEHVVRFDRMQAAERKLARAKKKAKAR